MRDINRDDFNSDEEFNQELEKIKFEIFEKFAAVDRALEKNLKKCLDKERFRNIKTLEQSRNTIICIKNPEKSLSKEYIHSDYIPIVTKDNGEYAEKYEILYKTIDHNDCKFWIKKK